ncbi:hypothetical protein Tco_0261234 [Tanacetum coccineum]
MVACLEKTEENTKFHQIMDFLSTCLINYALTVSPTIYASYIEQFWNTATSKIVNLVKKIHAIVDGKAVVISESLVRSDLLFNDKDGGSPRRQETIGGALAQTRSERVLEKPNEPPLSKDFFAQAWDPQTKAKSQEIRKKEKVKHLTPKKEDIQADSNFDVLDDDMEVVEGETVHTATTRVSAVSAPVTTAGVAISTAEPITPLTTAATAFIDEDLTIAQTLIKMKEEKAKEKGVAIKDVKDSPRPIRSITTLQPLPTIDPKDKGTGVLVKEEPKKPEKVKKKGSRVSSN